MVRDHFYERQKYSELYEMMWRLDELHFKDVGLRSKDITNRLGDTGSDLTLNIHLNDWWVSYSDREHRINKNYGGVCRGKQKRIIIRKSRNNKAERNTLLHEMIHAYEFMLPEHYRQYLVIYLYSKVAKKIGSRKLTRVFDSDSYIGFVKHNPLFLLKSLDLDIRFRRPLGTIYSYGREVFFRE